MLKRLEEILGKENINLEEPMAKHTTFRTGGLAKYFVSPSTIEEVCQVVALCTKEKSPYYVIGNGSNLLVSDKGYEGVIIHLGNRFAGIKLDEENHMATVLAGTSLSFTSKQLSKLGLGNMAFAAGIPGNIGGAVVMNAGAYGGEMVQVIKEVTYLDEDGQVVTKPVSELKLGYRTSIFKQSKRIVLEVKLQLTPMNAGELLNEIEKLNASRREKQPLEYPSAGSTFKRPEGYFAGKLIQDSGLRGYQVGGAMVSEKHCGFVINKNHATSSDIYQLIQDVQRIVYEKFGVHMEPEVQLVGEF
ncbi:UDP-N-acetylenolpyruvoylglucosamine reductase [Lachnospiraceae bacterium TWA4]|nr:UDP-N-acetylenolpyruvoylglucosamine reductase [Lachnospiraceae bacterium TWA4]